MKRSVTEEQLHKNTTRKEIFQVPFDFLKDINFLSFLQSEAYRFRFQNFRLTMPKIWHNELPTTAILDTIEFHVVVEVSSNSISNCYKILQLLPNWIMYNKKCSNKKSLAFWRSINQEKLLTACKSFWRYHNLLLTLHVLIIIMKKITTGCIFLAQVSMSYADW